MKSVIHSLGVRDIRIALVQSEKVQVQEVHFWVEYPFNHTLRRTTQPVFVSQSKHNFVSDKSITNAVSVKEIKGHESEQMSCYPKHHS